VKGVKKLDELIKILSGHKGEMQDRFKVKSLGLFGSYVRGEQKKKSDLDVLVEFREPVGLFHFMDLEEYLEKLVGVEADLVSKRALKPRIGRHIMEEVVYV